MTDHSTPAENLGIEPPRIIGHGIDLVHMHYATYRIDDRRLTPPETFLRRVYGDLTRPRTLQGMASTSVNLQMRMQPLENGPVTISGWLAEERMLTIRVRRIRGFGIPDVRVEIKGDLFTVLQPLRACEMIRAWVRLNLFRELSPSELHEMEVVSRIDFRYDVLVQADGPNDLDVQCSSRMLSRLRIDKIYDEPRFTGLTMGSDRLQRFCLYDKGEERRCKNKGDAQLASWNTDDLSYGDDGNLRLNAIPVRVWRLEWRYNRAFLHKKNIQTLPQALEAMPLLICEGFHNTVRLHVPGTRSRTGQVRALSPLAPLWHVVQEHSMAVLLTTVECPVHEGTENQSVLSPSSDRSSHSNGADATSAFGAGSHPLAQTRHGTDSRNEHVYEPSPANALSTNDSSYSMRPPMSH